MLKRKHVHSLCLVTVALSLLLFLNRNRNRINQEHQQGKLDHFKFPLHKWRHGVTCGDRDTRPACKTCIVKPNLWDCVGLDRSWSLVFVDNRPKEKRGPNFERLVQQAEVVVAHDTQGMEDYRYHFPKNWAGREFFTAKGSPPAGFSLTTLIKGDKDTDGKVFKRAIELFHSSEEVQQLGREFNPKSTSTGSHSRLLAAAALATTGDVFEMGTGFYSTPLLHKVVERQGGTRMILSTDTDANWLSLSRNMSGPFHQFRYIPVFEDGGTCGGYPGPSREPVAPEMLEFAGQVWTGLETNEMILCP